MKPEIIAKVGVIQGPWMVSGQAVQEEVKLYKAFRSERDGKFTDWFVGVVPNEGDYVYCREQGNYRSEGFGGRRMLFPLGSGSVEIQGPWHSNAESLFEETGYDCRHLHHTMGVIGLKPGPGHYSACDVVYMDTDWVLGGFNRVEDLAQELANKYRQTMHFWAYSTGGGYGHLKEPQ